MYLDTEISEKQGFKISRTFDCAAVNAIANDPSVLPFIGAGDGPADLTAAVLEPRNFALAGGGGVFVYYYAAPGIYEVHSLFPEKARKNSIRAARAGLQYMFTNTDAEQVVSYAPEDNQAALSLMKIVNFRHVFDENGRSHFSLTCLDWALSRPELATVADDFCAKIDIDLPGNRRPFGASLLMWQAGNFTKGVDFYNIYARLAGQKQIAITHLQPFSIAIEGKFVQILPEIEVLTCP